MTHYGYYYKPVQAHIPQLVAVLEGQLLGLTCFDKPWYPYFMNSPYLFTCLWSIFRSWSPSRGTDVGQASDWWRTGWAEIGRWIDRSEHLPISCWAPGKPRDTRVNMMIRHVHPGDSSFYKRRVTQRPEPGNPQTKWVTQRVCFDVKPMFLRECINWVSGSSWWFAQAEADSIFVWHQLKHVSIPSRWKAGESPKPKLSTCFASLMSSLALLSRNGPVRPQSWSWKPLRGWSDLRNMFGTWWGTLETDLKSS